MLSGGKRNIVYICGWSVFLVRILAVAVLPYHFGMQCSVVHLQRSRYSSADSASIASADSVYRIPSLTNECACLL